MKMTMETEFNTRQQLFDNAWNGLKAQRFVQSAVFDHTRHRISCRYRGPNGMKCAIGHSIADAVYQPELEGFTASAIVIRRAANIAGTDEDFAWSLQRVHDRATHPEKMKAELIKFAELHQLEVPNDE